MRRVHLRQPGPGDVRVPSAQTGAALSTWSRLERRPDSPGSFYLVLLKHMKPSVHKHIMHSDKTWDFFKLVILKHVKPSVQKSLCIQTKLEFHLWGILLSFSLGPGR